MKKQRSGERASTVGLWLALMLSPSLLLGACSPAPSNLPVAGAVGSEVPASQANHARSDTGSAASQSGATRPATQNVAFAETVEGDPNADNPDNPENTDNADNADADTVIDDPNSDKFDNTVVSEPAAPAADVQPGQPPQIAMAANN